MQYSDIEAEIRAKRQIFMEVCSDLFTEAHDLTVSLQRAKEMGTAARRAALRLVSQPKLGFEHLYLSVEQVDSEL